MGQLYAAAAAADTAGLAGTSGKMAGGRGSDTLFGCRNERLREHFVDLILLRSWNFASG